MNHEIVYERNPTGSYMKIFSNQEETLDEKILMRRKIPGLLPMEKAYLDGNGQYWYNISGKQSLDTYCSIQNVGIDVIKKIIISICSQMEILEWNLISMGSLLLEPECIFVTNSNQEFIFTSYPGADQNIEDGFRQLMEYLLTKVDHKDALAVHAAYGVYEKSLEEGMASRDVRDWLTRSEPVEQTEKKVAFEKPSANIVDSNANQREIPAVSDFMEEKPMVQRVQENHTYSSVNPKKQEPSKNKKKQWDSFIKEKFSSFGFKTAEKTKKKQAKRTEVVYPEEQIYTVPQPTIHPTVCLTGNEGQVRGVLLYQGTEQLSDIYLDQKPLQVGKGAAADVKIDKETISQLHARICPEGNSFYIEDLNSTNGTFVNDEALPYKQKKMLQANDIVRFADVRFRFC